MLGLKSERSECERSFGNSKRFMLCNPNPLDKAIIHYLSEQDLV